MAEATVDGATLAGTGIPGLDDVLAGGFTRNRIYLIEGDPGSGKTTLALKYLLEGVARGETCLYVTLSETREELLGVARSHDWDLDGIMICELVPSEESLLMDAQSRMFHPSEVELTETTRTVLAQVEKHHPTRVVFDSLSEMRLLAQSPLRYRRQILALKQFFAGRQCTVLLLDDHTSIESDIQLQSLAHGVVSLEHLAPVYGAERRRLRVIKIRGVAYRGGYHDFVIRRGGLDVYPRLVAAEHHRPFSPEAIPSGVAQLDELLGGGLNRGSSVLLVGPAGSGKSSIVSLYLNSTVARGERAAAFLFDEGVEMLLGRAEGLGFPLRRHVEAGMLEVRKVDPAELTPGQLAHAVRRSVEEDGARVVVLDSLNGYLHAMPEEHFLIIQLHELLTYLAQQGVVTILVVAQHGLIGDAMQAPVDASYLADSVILLRFFESQGRIRKAISVVKKRSGAHEDTLRELILDGRRGLSLSDPLEHYQGIMTGVPALRDNGRS